MTKHYEIFGYAYNPAIEEQPIKEDELDFVSDHKMIAENKKLCLGAVKIMLDNFKCKHISIFEVD